MESASRRLQTLRRHLTNNKVPNEDTQEEKFDMKKVFERYAHERSIRLQDRPEGTAQYTFIEELATQDARFAAMLKDPWVTEKTPPRLPVTDHVEVAIVGAGYAGLIAGARVVMKGISPSSVRLIDSASDVGGTWYWNRCKSVCLFFLVNLLLF